MGWRGETDTSDRSFSSPFPTVFRDVEDLVCVLCSFRPRLRVPLSALGEPWAWSRPQVLVGMLAELEILF